MRSSITHELVLAAVISSSLGCANAQPPAQVTRDISITITLRSPSDAPIAGVCVLANDLTARTEKDQEHYSSARTGSNGEATIQLTVPVGSTRVMVLPNAGGVGCQSEEDVDRFRSLVRSTYVEPWYGVEIQDTQSAYSLLIRAVSAYKIKGRIVGAPSGSGPVTVEIGNHYLMRNLANRTTGAFSISGISREKVGYLFARVQGERWTVIALPPPAASVDEVDLGDISLLPQVDGSECSVKLQRIDDVRLHGGMPVRSATLVRSDGSDVWQFSLNELGEAHRRSQPNAKPRVPVGTYFVAPAVPMTWNKCVVSLVSLLRDGRAAELEAVGVQKLVVVEDGSASIVLDAKVTEDAIAVLGGYK